MPNESDQLFTFYETLVFTEDLTAYFGKHALDVLYAIQSDLLADPERWPVVVGTGGARKGRVADPTSGKGKRGGYRYLYVYLERHGQIYLLFLFAKSEQATLTTEQTKVVARMVDAILEEVENDYE